MVKLLSTFGDTSMNQTPRSNSSRQLKSQAMKSLKHLLRAKHLCLQGMDPVQSRYLLSQGLAIENQGMLSPTSLAKQALRRFQLEKEEVAAFQSQHQDRGPIQVELPETDTRGEASPPRPGAAPVLNRGESPLSLLANRKKGDGRPLLSPSQVQAGERLRADFERAQCGPKMGINWQRLGQGGLDSRTIRAENEAELFSHSAQEARQRWRKALAAVGEEFAGPLIDLCCFLKGMEQIEKQRQWPARSAKLVLSLALSALARHYGFQDEAIGPKANPTRHWGDETYRPSIHG